MSGGRSRSTVAAVLAAALVAVAVLVTGCSYFSFVEHRALCPGLTADDVRRALADDPDTTTREEHPTGLRSDEIDLVLSCERDGITACVILSREPDEIVVHVGEMNRRPAPEEAARWRAQVEHFCVRLSAACPSIGTWEANESIEPPTAWRYVLGWLACSCVAVVAAIVLVVRRVLRRRPVHVAR